MFYKLIRSTYKGFLKNNDWEYIIVFDIDCIPLDEKIIPETIEWVKNNIGLFSVAQNPNHIKNAPDYASPAFIAFSKKTYDMLGQPSFAGTNKWDVGGQFTYEASKLGVEVKMMYPSHVEIPKWLFKDGTRFGIGTTYQNRIYHNFESRKNKMQGFINICKKIIG